MKKKKLIALAYQQSKTIQDLEKEKHKLAEENKYLRRKFMESKDFIMDTISGMIG